MKQKVVHKRKDIENQDKIEWENYQAEVELAIENH